MDSKVHGVAKSWARLSTFHFQMGRQACVAEGCAPKGNRAAVCLEVVALFGNLEAGWSLPPPTFLHCLPLDGCSDVMYLSLSLLRVGSEDRGPC